MASSWNSWLASNLSFMGMSDCLQAALQCQIGCRLVIEGHVAADEKGPRRQAQAAGMFFRLASHR
jgi:hypothetical protein